jgi:hypothetical protein
MEKKWEEMTADEKQEAQFQRLLTPKDPEGDDMEFQSKEAEANYKASVTRLKDAIQMKNTPDRIPISILPSMYPYKFGGITPKEAMDDYDKCASAFKKFILEFKPDMHLGGTVAGPSKFYERLDYKVYAWPGHGVKPEYSYQCKEAEYMKAEDYDLLITDPSLFWRNVYLPRTFGALEGLSMATPFTGIMEFYGLPLFFLSYGIPAVQESYKALFEAGTEGLKWITVLGGLDVELKTLGFPTLLGGFTKVPFDVLGDTLRGTKGIMTDLYRRPDKLLEALDRLVPIMINLGVGNMQQSGNPQIFMPLHKGADDFLSDEQFKKFYWGPFQKVIEGLVEGGCIPFPALEGHWTTRLDIIKDVPKGKTMWMVDQSDMEKAKKTLGRNACLVGNVPSSLLQLGAADEVKRYCKKIIDIAGKDGGYIMSNGAFFDEAKNENVKMMMDFTREYGVYS